MPKIKRRGSTEVINGKTDAEFSAWLKTIDVKRRMGEITKRDIARFEAQRNYLEACGWK